MHDPQWIEDLMEGTALEKEQAKIAIKNRIQQVVSIMQERLMNGILIMNFGIMIIIAVNLTGKLVLKQVLIILRVALF